jgi:hypothetical protein
MKWSGLLVVLGLAACAGVRTYPNDGAKNIVVRSALDSKVRAAVHLHQVDAKCHTEYQGSVAIDAPAVVVGVPAERLSYVVVTFDSSSFGWGSRTTSVVTLIEPRKGYSYDLLLTYRDSIYNVALGEIDAKGARREIPRRGLRCS